MEEKPVETLPVVLRDKTPLRFLSEVDVAPGVVFTFALPGPAEAARGQRVFSGLMGSGNSGDMEAVINLIDEARGLMLGLLRGVTVDDVSVPDWEELAKDSPVFSGTHIADLMQLVFFRRYFAPTLRGAV